MESLIHSSIPDDSPSSNRSPGSTRAAIVYEFDEFRLDPLNRLLTRAGKEFPLPGRAFDVLLMLVRRPGALLTKEEFLRSVWDGSFVEESNLTVAISTLRRVLSEDLHERRYIQTVARRGYRFIADVRELQDLPRAARNLPVASAVEPEDPGNANVVTLPQEEASGSPATFAVASAPARMRLWPVGIFAGILLAALFAGSWFLLRPTAPIHTLAVLPFTMDAKSASTSDSSADEVILLGITDGLISRLEDELVVRPTSSVLRYSPSPATVTASVDPLTAGHEQGVDAVLTGSMERSSDRTTLKLRLIRIRDGFTLWQDSFQGEPNGLSQIEQRAGDATAGVLHHFGAASPPKKPVPTAVLTGANDQAYQLYLRGRYFWNRRTVDGLRKSVDYFRQAIAADPNYAPAYAGLADSYALLASFSVEPVSSANADARSAALSAIQLDPALAEPHASLGMIYFYTDWNLEAAEREFERAIQLNPNYATAHHWYGLDLAAMGRFPQALYEIHLAQKLDPLSLIIGTNAGWVEYLSKDYAGATRDLQRVLELDPNFARARARLGMVKMATGDNAAAIANFTQAIALSGDEDPWVEGLLGDAEARNGDHAGAEHALDQLRKRSVTHYVPPISRGLVLIGLGRKAEAVTALAQAVDDRSTSMIYARVDPALDDLRGDSAFQALLEHIKP
jgi:DNA-binding winged helix-turn-helix (wHTH) protein/tetratricopeptide (TPR) repeat protein/TolB-like protein